MTVLLNDIKQSALYFATSMVTLPGLALTEKNSDIDIWGGGEGLEFLLGHRKHRL